MSNWYVVQVTAGKEEALCELIEHVTPEGVLEECFTPRYQTQMKVRSEWRYVNKVLFPGYLIAVTDCVDELWSALRGVSEFTRLLSVGEAFAPLSNEDRAWIGVFTERRSRVVPMSMGVMEGDRVVVTKGPLLGREALIKSINRRKSIAYLELEMFGRTLTTKVGLGIVTRSRKTE